MSTWSTHTNVNGSPDDVLAVLSDPDAIRRWSPIEFDVEYETLEKAGAGTQVWATVSVKGGGLVGRLLAQATDALLAAGALDRALGRIANEIDETAGAGMALAA